MLHTNSLFICLTHTLPSQMEFFSSLFIIIIYIYIDTQIYLNHWKGEKGMSKVDMGKSMGFLLGFRIIFIPTMCNSCLWSGNYSCLLEFQSRKAPLTNFSLNGKWLSCFPEMLRQASHQTTKKTQKQQQKNPPKKKKSFQCQLNTGHFQKMKCTASSLLRLGSVKKVASSIYEATMCYSLFSIPKSFAQHLKLTESCEL